MSELVQQDDVKPPRPDEIDTLGKLFSARALAWFWPFARQEPHGHPPFYAIEGLIGDWLAPSSPILLRGRLGPITAFSLTSGLIFGFFARRWGWLSASLASVAWVLQPNLFGHGHYATLDALLSSLWVMGSLAFWLAVERPGRNPRWLWVVALGVVCGWSADTKLTGWFLPIPLIVWATLYRSRRGWLALVVAGVLALLVLFAFNPCWWPDPINGLARFFRSNLNRDKTVPIKIQFLGQIYNTPRESLPWFNTIVWTVLVTPVGFLVLSVLGGGRGLIAGLRQGLAWFRRSTGNEPAPFDAFAALVMLQWGFLLTLRALPHTPGHDGVRQFLPAFGMLSLAGGVGVVLLSERFRKLALGLVLVAIVEGATSLAVMMPMPLSYFSPLVGGLAGATSLGMEPTYFWDGMTPEAVAWLNTNTPPGRTVRFATWSPAWLYLKQTGQLKAGLAPLDPGKPAWLVIQNRPGEFQPFERDLLRQGKPAFTVSKLGVPIVVIYPYPE